MLESGWGLLRPVNKYLIDSSRADCKWMFLPHPVATRPTPQPHSWHVASITERWYGPTSNYTYITQTYLCVYIQRYVLWYVYILMQANTSMHPFTCTVVGIRGLAKLNTEPCEHLVRGKKRTLSDEQKGQVALIMMLLLRIFQLLNDMYWLARGIKANF